MIHRMTMIIRSLSQSKLCLFFFFVLKSLVGVFPSLKVVDYSA